MQEQRERDISLLDETFSKVSRLGNSEQSTGPHRPGQRRPTTDDGTEELPGTLRLSDFDPAASSSKGALVLYQGRKAGDEISRGLQQRYHRNSSDVTTIVQKSAPAIHGGEEARLETTKQLLGRYLNEHADTTNSQKGALVILNGEKAKDESADEMPERNRRRPVERDTKQVKYGELSFGDGERDIPEACINEALPRETSSPISEGDPHESEIVMTDLSSENDLEDLSDGSSRPKRDRRASIGHFRDFVFDDNATTRRAERRTLARSQRDHSDGYIRSESDNQTSTGYSQYHSSKDDAHDRPTTRSTTQTHASKLPSNRGRRKGKKPQRNEAAPEDSTKRKAQAGRLRTRVNNNNGHDYRSSSLARLEGSNTHHTPRTESPLASSNQLIRGKASPADMGMRTLLVYRAILFATLCALAADTSCIYETELGRRVVQVL